MDGIDEIEVTIQTYKGVMLFSNGQRYYFLENKDLEVGKTYYLLIINNIITAYVDYENY